MDSKESESIVMERTEVAITLADGQLTPLSLFSESVVHRRNIALKMAYH